MYLCPGVPGAFKPSKKPTQSLHNEVSELRSELKALRSEIRAVHQHVAPALGLGHSFDGGTSEGMADGNYTRNTSFLSSSAPVNPRMTEFSGSAFTHVPGLPSPLTEPANEIVAHVWPQVGHWASEFLLKEVGPAVKDALPALGGHIDPDRTHLGHEPLQFKNIRIFDRKERTSEGGFCDNIVFRCRMEWHGDLSVVLKIAGAAVGIQGLTLKGQLLVELVHMLPYPPMFKGVRLFFLDPPDLDLSFSGAGSDILNVGMINRRIIDVFQSELASRVVAPKFMGFKMVNTDIFAITSPPPEGILRVTVWSASDLPAMDVSFFGHGKSDPYVKIRCGAHVFKSPTVWKTLSPNFDFKVSLPISSLHDQKIWVELYDQDLITRDDFLGKVALPVDLLANWGKQKKVTVQLRNEKGEKGKNGSVCMSAEWQPLSFEGDMEHTSGIVSVGVYSAMNVPNFGQYARYWISCSCTELMPCASSAPQNTEQVYAGKIFAKEEVDDADEPLIHRLGEKIKTLRSKGLSNAEIAEVLDLDPDATDFDAEAGFDTLCGVHVARWRRSLQFLALKAHASAVTFRLMAQGAGHPKPVELGSVTRHLADVIPKEHMILMDTVTLPNTKIQLRLRIQLRDLKQGSIAGKPERQRTYRTDALGDGCSVTSL
ncbi:unnamed protein product [Effrenium voratum]|uniref:Uncharacterized protein n=1 Tax=Effrenium voratum TaxID=2562239 RepID=A0AA36JNZ1_9DINO|nr:unnamed protein product [Effrenium voratum]